MKKYKVQILQMLILSAILIIYYICTVPEGKNANNFTTINSDISIKYGKGEDTFIDAKSKDSKIYFANKNLKLLQKESIQNTILGDTITSTKDYTYYNNFDEIFAIHNNQTKTYPIDIDKHLLDIIYNKQIKINDVYTKDDYYQSIANVKLESTINYQIDASIITQIKNGKRYDILVYENVQAITYNEKNNEIIMYYTTSNSNNSLANYNELVSSKLVWNDEINNYEQSKETITQGQKLSDLGITYITPYINDVDDVVNVIFSKATGLSDRELLHFYHGKVDKNTGIITDSLSFVTKTVPNDSTISISNTFEYDNKLYIFFSDMKYNEINFNDNTNNEYIISNTGVVDTIHYSNDGKNNYILYTSSKSIKMAKLEKGILTEEVETSKSDLKVSNLDYTKILEFDVAKRN